MIDRRFDLRVFVDESVSLTWTDPTGETLQTDAHLADISRSGASVRTQRPVRAATTVMFSYEDREYVGKVTHCKSAPNGYFLGVEFLDGYRWSPKHSPEEPVATPRS